MPAAELWEAKKRNWVLRGENSALRNELEEERALCREVQRSVLFKLASSSMAVGPLPEERPDSPRTSQAKMLPLIHARAAAHACAPTHATVNDPANLAVDAPASCGFRVPAHLAMQAPASVAAHVSTQAPAQPPVQVLAQILAPVPVPAPAPVSVPAPALVPAPVPAPADTRVPPQMNFEKAEAGANNVPLPGPNQVVPVPPNTSRSMLLPELPLPTYSLQSQY